MSASPVPPSGEQLTITHGRQTVVAVTGGGGLRSYEVGGVPLVDSWEIDRPRTAARGGPLQPWPNRIRDGRYTFDGVEQQLSLTEPARRTAIHGFALDHTWEVVAHEASSLSFRCLLLAQHGYPWPLELSATYALNGDGLTATIGATNVGSRRAPYGHGVHPYLRPGPGSIDGWTLHVPARTRLRLDEQLIPVADEAVAGTEADFSTPRPIGDTVLNVAYTDIEPQEDGRVQATVTDPTTGIALTLWADSRHPWLLVYTGDELDERRRQSVAIEPMTCPPNAFVTGRDLVVLEPGGAHTTTWGITPRGIDLG